MLALRRFAVRRARFFERTYGLLARIQRRLWPLWQRIGLGRLEAPFALAERTLKGAMFDCRMCGDCVLSETGMSCPMNCPKQMRHGPCGGVGPQAQCEVNPEMRCVWIEAWSGASRMRDGARRITLVRAPLDRQLQGRSAWLHPPRVPAPAADPGDRSERRPTPAAALERTLRDGHFAITAELNPPDSTDPDAVIEAAAPLTGLVDALNATDASGANCRMSSLAVCAILRKAGHEVVMQMSCRDRNRIAMQGDILGAAALGIDTVLCLTGDGVRTGDHPGAKPVFDLDSVSLLRMIDGMSREGRFLSGRRISAPPRLFLGAVENPCVAPFELRAERLAQKVAAGARFIQTNYVFDLERFERFMTRVRALGLHERVHILAGVGPLASARMARWLRGHVPGIHIPDAVIARLDRADDPLSEGQQLCVELIEALRRVPGVAGIHVMAHRREHLIAGMLRASGLTTERRARPTAAMAAGARLGYAANPHPAQPP